jgi:hypothetical protein
MTVFQSFCGDFLYVLVFVSILNNCAVLYILGKVTRGREETLALTLGRNSSAIMVKPSPQELRDT